MRDIAVISFAQTEQKRRVEDLNEVEMLMPATQQVLSQVDMTIDDIGFTCSGSTDYLAGVGFSFVSTLDGVGPWPPIQESHVEMDGAFALYEAWVKLQLGEIDTALVYSYSKSSPGDLPMVLTRQLDPYTVAPLWPDTISLAALQARAMLDAGVATEADFAAAMRVDSLLVRSRWPRLIGSMRWSMPRIHAGRSTLARATSPAARTMAAAPSVIGAQSCLRSGATRYSSVSSLSGEVSHARTAFGLPSADDRLRAATAAKSASVATPASSMARAWRAARLMVSGHSGATVYGSSWRVSTIGRSPGDDLEYE